MILSFEMKDFENEDCHCARCQNCLDLLEFGLDDFVDEEFPESVYWTATHNYECRVYNEMDRLNQWGNQYVR